MSRSPPTATEETVSMVLPTFNRLPALRETLPFLLAVEGVDEVVVVDDGSVDATLDYLHGVDDSRLRVVPLDSNRGLPSARNSGVARARGTWILMGEDDVRLPRDYARVLLATARAEGAQIVGAPWLHIGDRPLTEELAAARAKATTHADWDAPYFPADVLHTPFLPGRALIHRKVFDRVSFDTGFRGNAYREETSFFVEAVRHGFVSVITPHTWSYQVGNWAGGERSSRLHYEWWAARNNARFLRKHGKWLAEQGHIAGPVRAQVAFMSRRLEGALRGFLGARLGRLRGSGW